MLLPFISRARHEDVTRLQQELITYLKERVKVLETQLSNPPAVNVTVKLPDDFAIAQPAVVRRRTAPKIDGAPQTNEEIRWDEVDENDPVQLAKLAARELGGPTTPYVLSRTIQRITSHIRAAKADKQRRAQTARTVGAIESAGALQGEVEPPGYIPAHIQEMIAAAER